ncbi:MAG TPA: vanadium-dependent haloperoxidase [Thermoanaerobaculia bacterium]|nr:vanadium-dependent haloperoxidase [Thermoanaerobaculia bacterium]
MTVAAAAAPAALEALPCTATKIKKTGSNGDEERFKGADGKPNFIGNFSKGLHHDGFGEVDRPGYKSLLHALDSEKDFDQISLGLGRKLTNPQAGLANDLEGPDPQDLSILAAPSLDSAEEAAEAVELYWMALLRDVPFVSFGSDADVAAAAAEISTLQEFTGPKLGGQVTPQTIFRGCAPGDVAGPFLSQYLLHDIGYGSLTIEQRQRTVVPNQDYLTAFGDWLHIQNGGTPATGDTFDTTPRYIRSMRDMGQYVHVDALYEAYLNACLILLHSGAPFDAGNPYEPTHPDATTQIGFGTFGGPHVLSLVTEVATRALKAIWYQKWFVHRRLRPEAFGGLIEVKQVGVGGQKRTYPIHQQVLNSQALQRTVTKYGSNLLPMAFPEGSPTHPAYGAGHATVAGACVTILKAWFDEDARLADLPVPLMPKVANADGTALVDYTGADAGSLTVGGELNKVAANIAIGRNMAGVHWRSDYAESVKLGERVALTVLKKQRRDYHEKGWSFTLRRFDGTKVTINHRGVFTEDGHRVPL